MRRADLIFLALAVKVLCLDWRALVPDPCSSSARSKITKGRSKAAIASDESRNGWERQLWRFIYSIHRLVPVTAP